MRSVLPISLIVNSSLSVVPQGLSQFNINSVLLLSEETPNNLDDYRVYVEPASVAADYGSNSKTAQFANDVFSQSPNILSGDGRLIIAPISAISATNGDFTTADLSANLANLILVNDGDLRITLNGNNIDLTGLDFTTASTLADIVKLLNKKEELINVNLELVGNTIVASSQKVGVISECTFAQLPAGAGTDLSGATFFNVAGGTATVGTDSSGETIIEAIDRLENMVGFGSVFSTLRLEDDAIELVASGIQSRKRLFLYEFSSQEDLAGICTTIKDSSYTFTRCLYYNESIEDSQRMLACYVGRGFSVNWAGTNTAITMNLKRLVGIQQDRNITVTIYNEAQTAGADTYDSFGGLLGVSSSTANQPFDLVYGSIWLDLNIQIAGLNVLATTSTKIDQTEEGMNQFKAGTERILDQGVRVGFLAPGEWNSPQTFGNPDIFRDNIRQNGYYQYSLPISQQNQADRELRKAPLLQYAVKSSGAFHSANIIGIIEP